MRPFQTERKIASLRYIYIQSSPRLPSLPITLQSTMFSINAIDTPLDFIKFMDRQFRNGHPLRATYEKHFSKLSRNPDAIEWAAKQCSSRFNPDVYHLWYEELVANGNSIGLNLSMRSKRARWIWANSRGRFSNADLSGNCSDEAAKVIEFSFEFSNAYRRHNRFDVPTLCKNPNPVVVRVVEDYYFSKGFNDSKFSFTFYNPVDTLAQVMDSPTSINLASLAANPSATEFVLNCFLDYFTSTDSMYIGLWSGLSTNPHPMAISFLIKHWTRVDLSVIAMNPNKDALDLMQSLVPNARMWKWGYLSANPAAIHLLKMHPNRISYKQLSRNPHQWALRHLARTCVSNWCVVSILNMLECCYRKPYYHDWVDFHAPTILPVATTLAPPRIRRPAQFGNRSKQIEKKQTLIQTPRIAA